MKGEPRDQKKEKKREGERESSIVLRAKQKVLAEVLPNAGERNFSGTQGESSRVLQHGRRGTNACCQCGSEADEGIAGKNCGD